MLGQFTIFVGIVSIAFSIFTFILMCKHWVTLNLIQQACKQLFKQNKYKIELVEIEINDESIDKESIQKCAKGRFTNDLYENEWQFIRTFTEELSTMCSFQHHIIERFEDNIESSEYVLELSNFSNVTGKYDDFVAIIRFYIHPIL